MECVLLGVSVDVWTNSPTGGAKTRFVQLQEPSSMLLLFSGTTSWGRQSPRNWHGDVGSVIYPFLSSCFVISM